MLTNSYYRGILKKRLDMTPRIPEDVDVLQLLVMTQLFFLKDKDIGKLTNKNKVYILLKI